MAEGTGTTQTPEDVLRFWFGEPGAPAFSKSTLWWSKDDATDAEIRRRFEATLEAAVRGELDGWRKTPHGRVAFVVLLDQFSRNMFRGTERAFAQDELALRVACEALDAKDDEVLSTSQAVFLLMPLEHAEDRAMQRRCIEGFEKLLRICPGELRDEVKNNAHYAELHARIVERFGRFPHRNPILGRTSTPDEIGFLKEPHSSF